MRRAPILLALLLVGCPQPAPPDDDPCPVHYPDADGDGFGNGAFGVPNCDPTDGWVTDATDCDDTSADAVPEGGVEVCDGLDNDCDGLVDDDDPDLTDSSIWYPDADGDGFGDSTAAVTLCFAPPGHVALGGDCLDTDATVNPGAHEEWFDGTDSDCDGALEPDACDDPPPGGDVPANGGCTYTPPVGGFSPVVEWTMPAFLEFPDYTKSFTTPVVGNITDDDGDGVPSVRDVPDIVIVTLNSASHTEGAIRVISGDGSAVHWSRRGVTYDGLEYFPYRYAQVALGDIDADGFPEIVTTLRRDGSCYAGAYDHLGDLEWVYPTALPTCRSHAPSLADLDGDGAVEVLFGRLFLDGSGGFLAEGTEGWGFWPNYSNSGYISFGVDLDGDGTQEVLAGNTLYDINGDTICQASGDDGQTAAADLDGDGQGEFVLGANGKIGIYETNCAFVREWDVIGNGHGGPPTIADFDGDGAPEIGVAGATAYAVYEVDGSELWSMPTIDASSNSTGSSVFDFDGDGQAEVVYADEQTLWIFDGATGAVLLGDGAHRSGTINEYPTIADVDADGKAEIVLVHSNAAGNGLTVWGEAEDNWVTARPVWNQHAYSISNIHDDLSVPTNPLPNWPTWNTFRQGGVGALGASVVPDLGVDLWGPCQGACGEDVSVYLQALNDGALLAPADVEVAVYGETATGERTELRRQHLGDPLDEGVRRPPDLLLFPAGELAGFARLVAVIDDLAAVNECTESDNEATLDLADVCQ